MNRMVKNSIFLAVAAAVFIEAIVLWVMISDLNELKGDTLSEAKSSYKKVHRHLEDIRIVKEKTGGRSLQKGSLGSADINKMARASGIDQNPHVRQWPVNSRNKNYDEQRSEIKLFRITASSAFKFLSILEKNGGSAVINSLTIIKTRGKENIFDLIVWYSTFNPKKSKNT